MKRIVIFAMAVWFCFGGVIGVATAFSKEVCLLLVVFSIWLFVISGCAIKMERASGDDLKKSEA